VNDKNLFRKKTILITLVASMVILVSAVDSMALPASYDAMALGYVTPVKDQGSCGSCWIFAATADFESDVAIGESSKLDFSEQEVGDCNIWSSVGGHSFCNCGKLFHDHKLLYQVRRGR